MESIKKSAMERISSKPGLPAQEPMKISFLTHKGLIRDNNEDRFLVKEFENGDVLLAIADGMGGHAAGEKAAQLAVDVLSEYDPGCPSVELHLVGLVSEMDRRIRAASAADATLEGMGTTLTALVIRAGVASWVHVGDTRLYWLHGRELTQVTEDHTIPGMLMKQGELTKEAARFHPLRNMLLKCLGCEEAQPNSGVFSVKEGDILLLSSDGLHDAIGEEEILAILQSLESIEKKMHNLVQSALNAGGRDNITVVATEL